MIHYTTLITSAIIATTNSQSNQKSIPDFFREKYPCESSEFRCYPSNLCISKLYVCNSQPNCPDQSDELNCDNVSRLTSTIASLTEVQLESDYDEDDRATRPSSEIIKDSVIERIDQLLVENQLDSLPKPLTTANVDSFLSEIGLPDDSLDSDFIQISTLQ